MGTKGCQGIWYAIVSCYEQVPNQPADTSHVRYSNGAHLLGVSCNSSSLTKYTQLPNTTRRIPSGVSSYATIKCRIGGESRCGGGILEVEAFLVSDSFAVSDACSIEIIEI
jgi:hypothetical protein